jgi:hypothetical protein
MTMTMTMTRLHGPCSALGPVLPLALPAPSPPTRRPTARRPPCRRRDRRGSARAQRPGRTRRRCPAGAARGRRPAHTRAPLRPPYHTHAMAGRQEPRAASPGLAPRCGCAAFSLHPLPPSPAPLTTPPRTLRIPSPLSPSLPRPSRSPSSLPSSLPHLHGRAVGGVQQASQRLVAPGGRGQVVEGVALVGGAVGAHHQVAHGLGRGGGEEERAGGGVLGSLRKGLGGWGDGADARLLRSSGRDGRGHVAAADRGLTCLGGGRGGCCSSSRKVAV